MTREILHRLAGVTTEHNVLVLVLGLVVTGAVVAGIGQLQLESQPADNDALGDTDVAQKQQYIQANYENETATDLTADTRVVYIRDDGNVLSKGALLESLRFQRTVFEDDAVTDVAVDDRPVVGVANLVALRAAREQSASLDEQITALEDASESEVKSIVAETLTEGSPALELLPQDYEPGSTDATTRRILFRFDANADDKTLSDAQQTLYGEAATQSNPEYFTLGEHATADFNRAMQTNFITLVVPIALAIILVVLAFAYRDLVDILVGFTGVVLSVLWMFGILGWLQISAGNTMIIGVVLVVGLSVDYGLHVFTRYREERGDDEPIRRPMARSLAAVAVALALVTITTGLGFLSNAANELTSIRTLAFAITLGVVSSFVIFVTVVPALKVTIDSALESVGLDRRKAPLGKTRLVEPVLESGVTLAKRSAPVVIVVAVIAGGVGAAAWTQLDRQAFQQQTEEAAEWKQDLPEPLAWNVPEYREQADFVLANYRSADEADRRDSNLLVEGDVTADGTLEHLHDAKTHLRDSGTLFERPGDGAPFQSPVDVMERIAANDESFAETFAAADTDGDGIPDENLETVYDELYAVAPDQASRVIHRSDGDYQSLRVVVPFDRTTTVDAQTDHMHTAAGIIDNVDGLTATGVGQGTLLTAELSRIANSILNTLLVALTAVTLLLVVVYRIAERSATLGAVTAFPVALVTAFVVGGMYVLDVPLTLLTALLLSLVVGLGIDYSVHVTDRFAHERREGLDTVPALREALTGTGGALLGSTLTTTGAFSTFLLLPHPQFQSFGMLVVLALTTSFAVTIFVLPSWLYVWSEYVGDETVDASRSMEGATNG